MGIFETIGMVVVAGGAGAIMSLIGGAYLRSYVQAKRTEPVDIRDLDAPAGAVELTGTAGVHDGTSRSPFTDTETLLHHWRVEGFSGPASETSAWQHLASGQDRHPFELDDGTGTALVDPAGTSPLLDTTTQIEVGPDEEPPQAVASFLERSEDVDGNADRNMRYTESRLDPGGDAHVLGPVRESGYPVDLPGGVDAVVGVENPEDRGITVGEDDLSIAADREQAESDTDRFVVSNADESGAEREMLKAGVVFLGVGLLLIVAAVVILAVA